MAVPIAGKMLVDVGFHAVKRTASVVIILALLVGVPYYFHQMGFKKGYSKAVKDRPTYQAESMSINQFKGYNFTGIRLFGIVLGHLKDVRDESPVAVIERIK